MDKQRPGITVNINGHPRPFTIRRPSEGNQPDEPSGHRPEDRPSADSANDGQPVGHYQVRSFQVSSRQTDENQRTGRQIGEQKMEKQAFDTAKEEEAAALEEADGPIISISEAVQKKKKTGQIRRSWRLPPHVKSLFLAAAIAAVVGMAFGMTMLRLIPKEKAEPSPAAEAMTELTEAGTATGGERAEGVMPRPFSIAVIQAGVYSDTKAAARAAESIEAAGVPVVIAGQKPAALYIAVGADKEGLRAVNDKYRKAVSSTYVKELSFADETKERQLDIVQKGEALYETMAALSAALLAGKGASEEEWQALSKAYGSLEKSEATNNKTVQKYAEALKQAYLALAAYKENEEEALLGKAQQLLLEALSVYMELVPLRS
ncbi:stage II sporulation protein D [Geobacillus sp. 46C-IIa]|uniref:stage II sporulation protein D n=1 Tax=Geobacillus sp. 46C-IIa TaxID=1963025 RepID=UPI0009BE90DC|nr:stage II sporulation protein D [Geobacillus sp. 46C-IIa]OQP06405.1 stage II sporulation protein D [Geobacillus sp. 46C-IIa]QNU28684.1 stage II sporulation protein D [Geobacillus sp. 46C-IIa]